MDRFFHSVTLEHDRCVGCTVCVKHCPTEAIRIRDGKAQITKERCIDCGECIRHCPHRAKKARYDHFSDIQKFRYKIALPAPTLYGQFPNVRDINLILTALLRLGFDEVYEVAKAAELVTEATRRLMQNGHLTFPIISSACPAIARLIRVRFPDLCDHVLPLNAPMETAASLAKEEASKRLRIPKEEIGCIFITPCAAKVTDIKMPIGTMTSEVDLAVSISEIFPLLADEMKKIDKPEPLSQSGVIGVSWSSAGGEASGLQRERYLAADGIRNCIHVLEELEDNRLHRVDFIELNACEGGCVGGVGCVENGFVAKARLQNLRKFLPISRNRLTERIPDCMKWNEELEYAPVMKLSEDLSEAMQMMMEIHEISEKFPGKDCGACGAPSCKALAEDVVKGHASEDDCIFLMQNKLRAQLEEMQELTGITVEMLEESIDRKEEHHED